MKVEDQDLRTFIRRLKIMGGAACIVLVLSVWFYGCTFSGGIDPSPDTWGQFGDYLGAAGTILSFLGLVALLMTLTLQMKELKEMSGQLDIQNQASVVQQKTAVFFNMLDLHNRNVSSMEVDRPPSTTQTFSYRRQPQGLHLQGRAVLAHIANNFIQGRPTVGMPEMRDLAGSAFGRFYENHRGHLGHYFRGLYWIFKYLDESTDIPDEEKHLLARIARSQLSDEEIVLLFFNGLSAQGTKFAPLIERFALLNNLDWGLIPDWQDLRVSYKESAYGLV